MKTTRLKKPNFCTACGKLCDAATSVDDATPSPGDVTVCLNCGHIMIFAADLQLRDPTAVECMDIAGDKQILAIQKARGRMK